MTAEGTIRGLNKIQGVDKLGVICSTLIIIFSFFSKTIDTLMTFLFGASAFSFFVGISLNTNDIPLGTNLVQHRIYYKNYPNSSKVLFVIASLLFVVFLVRLVINLIKI